MGTPPSGLSHQLQDKKLISKDYVCDYKTEGYYVLTTFAAASELPRELERNLNNDEGILRFLVVRQNG